MRGAIIVLALATAVLPAFGQQDTEYIQEKALLAVAAFDCSVVATDEAEVERLFLLGYESGREFLNLVRGDIEDLDFEVLPLWTLYGGPSTDFILGQVYANRVNSVYDSRSNLDSESAWTERMTLLYERRNCRFVGR